MLQNVALDDRRALSSAGQRFVYNVVADWRSNVSSKTQRRNLDEDRGAQLWPDLGNRGAQKACVVDGARDWTHSVLVYVHVPRVRIT